LSPQQGFEWDESVANEDPAADLSDDVNSLPIALNNKSSYLGTSSIAAIIRVIVQIAPDAKIGFLAAMLKLRWLLCSDYFLTQT
jgi:hypothetical protein